MPTSSTGRHVWIGLWLLTACADITGPDVTFTDHRALEPVPVEYAHWYAETEKCLGLRGDFSAVRWLTARSIHFDGRDVVALTWDDDITVREDRTASRMHVRHEAAHHITRRGEELHIAGTGWVRCDGVH